MGWGNRRVRLVLYQVAFGLGLAALLVFVYRSTAENLARRRIGTGFAFLWRDAGFSLGEVVPLPLLDADALAFIVMLVVATAAAVLVERLARRFGAGPVAAGISAAALVVLAALVALRAFPVELVSFDAQRSFALGIATGLANTVKVAVLGCLATTALGFVIGIARLSANPLVRGVATVYVELFRNVPLLIQIFFWYFAVLRALPGVRQSLTLFDAVAVNNRGIFLPSLTPTAAAIAPVLALVVATALAAWTIAVLQPRRRGRAGLAALAAVAVVTVATAAIAGAPFIVEYPQLGGFNISGGMTISPEYGALLFGLTLYTAAFIAEIVRSGIAGVSRGQREAALAVGLTHGQTMRLVVVPQALRVAIPPLISQYLSLTKDSSLGIAIGYPEIVSVSAAIINQTGQAIEMLTVTLLVYLALSLGISAFLNWYNARMRWVSA